jgi:TolA-binding protein
MLKHINKQLTKNELYEVEKHMLDCELCSDAHAGMQYAENSSMLFAIDNTIDKRAGGGSSKLPIMRRLMVAASVFIILFGTYFSVNYFNDAVDNGYDLALNEEKEVELNEMPIEEPIMLENSEINRKGNDIKNEEQGINLDRNVSLVENENKLIENSPIPVSLEFESNDLVSDDTEIMEDIEESEVVLVEEVVEEVSVPEMRSAAGNVIINVDEVLMKEEKAAVRTKNTSKKKTKNVNVQEITVINVASSESVKYKDEAKDYMLTIEGFKVFDYKEEYQRAYDNKEANDFVTESISAGYETKADKDIANKVLAESIVEVTYKDALDKAMRLYKNEKYIDAIQEYDNILAKHPEDVNAQFYYGLCKYHLGQNGAALKKFDSVLKNRQTEFNEEANWYKALTLVEMMSTTAAKELLGNIVKQNGFYKAKAEEKLKEFK